MGRGISDANWKAVYDSLRAKGMSHEEARAQAIATLSWGAAPDDPAFGPSPESRLDGAPSEPLVIDAVAGGGQRLPLPYPAMSQGQYSQERQMAERGLGPMPEDAFETDADIRNRYDRKYGTGSFEADAPGRSYRAGVRQPGPAGYEDMAAAVAEVETGKTKAQRLQEIDALERRQDAQKASYDQATGLPAPGGSGLADVDEAGRDWSGWRQGMPLPPAGGRSMGPGDDSQRGPGYSKVPGHRLPNGMPVEQGDVMRDPKEIAKYRERQWDAERGVYKESPEDRDLWARGMLPVNNPDGSVGYSVGYMPGALGKNMQGSPGRAGQRRDLEDAGWEPQTVDGPTGAQAVYRPGESAQNRYDDYKKERQLYRMAKAAGLTPQEMKAKDESFANVGSEREGADARDLVEAQRTKKAKEREDLWRAQMTLAGGRPTGGPGGTKAQTGALMQLPEADRAQVIKDRMMPRGMGREDADFNNKLALLRADMDARSAEGRAARESESTERDKDRDLRRDERAAAEATAERRYNEERAQRDAEWKDREKKYEQEQLLATQRHEASMGTQTAQLEGLRQSGTRAEAELELLRSKQEQEVARLNEARQMALQAKAEQDAAAMAGAGGIDIVRGNYETPAAQASFKKIAADADQTWNGFFTEDAERMDAVLVRLGVTDPDRRRSIVQEYGINSDFPGYHGRGSVLSNWRVAHPAYAPVTPAQ